MRPARRVIIVAAFAAAGLTGCADRPNDLDTYYDDTTKAAEATEATEAGTESPATASPRQEPTRHSPAADEAELSRAVAAAVLTAEDVAAEGVQPVAPVPSTSGCLTQVPRGLAPAGSRDARWEYPTGSVLEQLVTVYPARDAADMLAGRVRCTGQELTVPAQPAVEAQTAWCEDTTCTVLLASGAALSGVQVTAGDAQRAAEAVRRLAPVAAIRLAEGVTGS